MCVIVWLQLVGHLLLVVKKVADQLHLPNGYRVGRQLCVFLQCKQVWPTPTRYVAIPPCTNVLFKINCTVYTDRLLLGELMERECYALHTLEDSRISTFHQHCLYSQSGTIGKQQISISNITVKLSMIVSINYYVDC